jgi:asparagine synthase (glutamine-hydrolysing)
MMPHELRELAGPALRDRNSGGTNPFAELAAVEQRVLAPGGAERPAASVARLETRLYLGAQLLRDIDVMGMAHSLEVRLPFVDHVLLGAVWPDLGEHPSLMSRKRLLHETLARPLPPETSGPKQGFTLPFAKWIQGGLAPFVREGLAHLAESQWLAKPAPARIWSEWCGGASHWSRPWGLAVLGHFLRGAQAGR